MLLNNLKHFCFKLDYNIIFIKIKAKVISPYVSFRIVSRNTYNNSPYKFSVIIANNNYISGYNIWVAYISVLCIWNRKKRETPTVSRLSFQDKSSTSFVISSAVLSLCKVTLYTKITLL